MPKPKTATGEKNLISKRLIELREKNHMSQRMLAHQLQLRGYDMDKNVITRIETNKRFVTDVEIKAFSEKLQIKEGEIFPCSNCGEPINILKMKAAWDNNACPFCGQHIRH